MTNICIRNAYKNIYFLKNVRALIDRAALTSWKIGNYFSSLFLTSTSGEYGGGSEPKRVFGGCSDRAALEFPLEISSTSLYICHKLSSVRTFASQRERVQLASFDSFHNHGGGFRSVRYSFFTRSPCFEDACFHSHVLFDSLSVGYFGSPGLEFIPGREKISGIRGTNDSVGWLRYSKLDEIDEWQTFRSNI